MDLTITAKGFDEFANRFARWPAIFTKHFRPAVSRSVLFGEGLAKKLVAKDTRHLARSITNEVRSAAGSVRGTWGTALSPHYGPDVEYGTRPHWPPVAALAGWARRHGVSPYAVAASIAKHGTKAQPFMRPSFRQAAPKIRQELRLALKSSLAELKGGA